MTDRTDITSAIRLFLSSDDTLRTLLGHTDTVNKIVSSTGNNEVPMPFVEIDVMPSGGRTNRDPIDELDVTVRVFVMSDKEIQSNDIATRLEEILTNANINERYNGWLFYTRINKLSSYFDHIRQGKHDFYKIGSYYRLRMVRQ